jgi:hypothetical protein
LEETLALPEVDTARRSRGRAARAQLGGQPSIQGGLSGGENLLGAVRPRLTAREAFESDDPFAVLFGDERWESHAVIISQV